MPSVQPEAYELAESLCRVLALEFTDGQRRLFFEAGFLEGRTASSAAREAADRLGVDRSTARKNLDSFRRLGWLTFGDRNSKGTPLVLTATGRLLHGRLSASSMPPAHGGGRMEGRFA